MIIFCDIDGVLTLEIEGHDYKNRTPLPNNIKKINELYKKGHKIILWTARYKRDFFITRKWLKKNNVFYHHLKCGKPKYDILIDDKSFSIEENIL